MIEHTQSGKPMTKQQRHMASSLIHNLYDLQKGLKEDWVRSSLPADWTDLDPVKPKKTRVTIRLDADLVRLFRKLGPGYGARINQILRVYVDAVAAGKVRTGPELEDMGPNYLSPLLEVLYATSQFEGTIGGREKNVSKNAPTVARFMRGFVEDGPHVG